ncbi:MAG TPA: PAS domain-containing protein, partial [Burkholderiaceae bacterium]|nr:PAS domain-containing protein [Burkholderiaceae bacterium]
PARLLRAAVRGYRAPGGQRRFMAAVEDRSAEEERDLAQSQLGALIDTAGVGLATFQEDSGWVQLAQPERARKRAGAAALQSIGREIVAPESLAEFERLQHALRHAERAEVRYAIDHPTLGRRWLLTRVEPSTLASGQRTTSVVTLDVSEQRESADARQRAERAVARQAERTRSILDSVLVGIVTVGAHGIEWMNRSAQRMFGAALADFIGLPIATVATAEPGHPFRRADRFAVLAEGEAETFECRVKARDGREFSIVGNVVCTAREAEGRQLTYALLDIERRREAEARMSQAQSQLQRIIEAAPLAITLRDARTLTVLQLNAVAAASSGLAPHELIGRTPEQLFDPAVAAQRRADMEEALATRGLVQREYRESGGGEPRVWDARYLPLASTPDAPPDQLLLVATDVTEQRAAQEARLEAAIAQREMLVREVHHRIKNNLQGVAGLLQQIAQRKPEVAGPIAEVVGQVQAIAQVYGLQVGASGPLQLLGVLRAIAQSVQRTFGRPIGVEPGGADAARWMLPEAEAIPIALTLNELLTNAVKHGGQAPGAIDCTLDDGEAGPRIAIFNDARLPAGFNLARIPGGVSGLGLVRALLPRRGATLTLEQRGERVEAALALKPPVVARGAAGTTP